MKKILLSGLTLLVTSSAFASLPCEKAAIAAAQHQFPKAYVSLDSDTTQPQEGGTYHLAIFVNECWYNTDIKMRPASDNFCQPVSKAAVDESSANCN